MNEQVENLTKVNQHNAKVILGGFQQQDTWTETIRLIMGDIAKTVAACAKEQGVECHIQMNDEGGLDAAKYWETASGNIAEMAKQHEEAKKTEGAPKPAPLIARPKDSEVLEFGGDYHEDSGNT